MDPKLTEITTQNNFRGKVEANIENMMAKGMKPKIHTAKRSLAEQKRLKAQGFSWTLKSYHLPGKDGLARAADIVDRDTAWNASKRFWLMLGSAAMAHNVAWGGLWGLSLTQRRNVVKCILLARSEGWPIRSEAYQVSLGKDLAHVENSKSNWPG